MKYSVRVIGPVGSKTVLIFGSNVVDGPANFGLLWHSLPEF